MPVGHFLGMLCHHHQGNSSEQNSTHGFLATHTCKIKSTRCFSQDFERNTCTERQAKDSVQKLHACDSIPRCQVKPKS